jgi:hypothetical protein
MDGIRTSQPSFLLDRAGGGIRRKAKAARDGRSGEGSDAADLVRRLRAPDVRPDWPPVRAGAANLMAGPDLATGKGQGNVGLAAGTP